MVVTRLLLAVSLFVALGVVVPVAQKTPRAWAASELSLTLDTADPDQPALSGRVDGVEGEIEFVTVTVTLDDGSSLSLNVDGSSDWAFSFGEIPTESWVGISMTESPIPVPSVTDDQQWDYAYMPGYYFPYPVDPVPAANFPGYTYPAGYGWNTYPFGAYAWAQYLNDNYSLPYYWTYAPLEVTPSYTYYGVAGMPATYTTASVPPTAFGTWSQPQYLQLAPRSAGYSYSTGSPYRYSSATASSPTVYTTLASRVVVSPVLVPYNTLNAGTVSSPIYPRVYSTTSPYYTAAPTTASTAPTTAYTGAGGYRYVNGAWVPTNGTGANGYTYLNGVWVPNSSAAPAGYTYVNGALVPTGSTSAAGYYVNGVWVPANAATQPVYPSYYYYYYRR